MMSHKISDYVRVTDVLYPFSGLRDVPAHVLKNAADRGTKVHEFCAARVNHLGVLEMEDDITGYMKSFEQWVEGKNFVKHPGRLYCEKLIISGEIDGMYENETGFTLFDWKTPQSESKTWRLQGSAYSYLCKLAGYNITKIEFIQLSKQGKEPRIYHYQEDMETFIKCLEIYRTFFLNVDNLAEYL